VALNGPFIATSCGTSNANGKLTINAPGILPAGTECAGLTIEVCAVGFDEGGCIEGVGDEGDSLEVRPCVGITMNYHKAIVKHSRFSQLPYDSRMSGAHPTQ
jgi:hypothetical protein